ncbi:hypothetical protein C8Q74DRAFT_103156 [Fomes fomentarius]|nr:hypothetical protein C8Q74DRAFT_103156 [Fomes fomentarius]
MCLRNIKRASSKLASSAFFMQQLTPSSTHPLSGVAQSPIKHNPTSMLLSRDGSMSLLAESNDLPGTPKLTSPNNEPPASFPTLNYDIYADILSHLSPSDLFALIRTCRSSNNIVVEALCDLSASRSIATLDHLQSFERFLRIGSSSTRSPYIKVLEISVPAAHPGSRITPDAVFDILLRIIQHCSNLRRLSIDGWYFDETSTSIAYDKVSELKKLEELSIPSWPQDDHRVFHQLAQLPLRRLAIWPEANLRGPDTTALWQLQSLASSLVELRLGSYSWRSAIENPRPPDFVGVRKLSICLDDELSLFTLATMFPNITHLALCERDGYYRSNDNGDTARMVSRYHWKEHNLLDAWPDVQAIWAEDLSILYSLALPSPRKIPFVSIRDGWKRRRFDRFKIVLSEANPTLLEMRVEQERETAIVYNFFEALDTGCKTSIRKLALHLEGVVGTDPAWSLTCELIGKLTQAVRKMTQVTHILVRLTRDPSGIVPDQKELNKIASYWGKYLTHSSPTLRWVAIDVEGYDLMSWHVCHTVNEVGAHRSLAYELTHGDGMRVMEAEQMGEFPYRG